MKKAFTLFEILVVVSLLVPLTLYLLPNLKNMQYKGRDTRRKSDLKQLQKALELYRQCHTNSQYPAAPLQAPNTEWKSLGSPGESCPANTVYIRRVPGDPLKIPHDYYYYDSNGLTYTLCTCLENLDDPERHPTQFDCNALTYDCPPTGPGAGAAYFLQEP